MRKLLVLATAAFLISGFTLTIDNSKKKTTKAKKANCTKGKSCSKDKSRTASI